MSTISGGQGLQATGGAIGAFGSYMAASNQADAYEFQAQLKMIAAEQEMIAAQREAGLAIKKGDQIKDAQVVGFASAGVSVGTGSPMLQMAATLADARDESGAIMEAGRYRKFVAETEAANYRDMAKSARTAGVLSAIGSVVGSAAKLAGG